MGRLIKTVLGKSSGKVGDLVFRIVNGKVFITTHIGTNKISKSPACVNNRKRFSSILQFASAVTKVQELKMIWDKNKEEARCGYNKIISSNIKFLENNFITVKNKITPVGFQLKNLNISLTKQKISVSFKLGDRYTEYSGKTFSACFILTFTNPKNKSNKASISYNYVYKNLKIMNDEENIASITFSKKDAPLFSKYRNAIVFFAIADITSDEAIFSNSHSAEFPQT